MRILIPVDGSKHSFRALELLKANVTAAGISPEVRLFFCQEPVSCQIAVMEANQSMEAYYKAQAAEVFDAAAAVLGDCPVKPEMTYAVGEPQECIAHEAELFQPDLVVMGIRGQSPVKGLLFGSVSNATLKHLHCPVLMLRDRLPDFTKPMRVGIAVDGSPYSEAAVNFVLNNAEAFGPSARFELINAGSRMHPVGFESMANMSAGADENEIRHYREKQLRAAVDPLLPLFAAAQISPAVVELDGDAGQTIAEHADKAKLDLLVMGSHGYGNLAAVMLGSVAMKVASSTNVPLLIIRQ